MTQHVSVARRTEPGTDAPQARRRRERPVVYQRRTLVTAAGGAAILLVAAVAVMAVRAHGTSPAASGEMMPAPVSGAVTEERAPQRTADRSGIPGVLAWDTRGWPGNGSTPAGSVEHRHVPGPVRYTELPPIGGPHSATWLNAGIYDKPVPSEHAVHDMEHGAVWITYRPSLSTAQVDALRSVVLKQSELPEETETGTSSTRYIVLSPWDSDKLPSPIVLSSWGHQLRLATSTDPRLQRFVDVFRSSQDYTPEHGEAVDGIPSNVGGRPLID